MKRLPALAAALVAIPAIAMPATYQGGGYGTAYTVTVNGNRASFVRTGPHEAGATLYGAGLVSQKGDTSVYSAPIPRKFWSAFADARRPVECRMAVHFSDHRQVIDGIRASQPCIFFHGAELGFGLYGGQVLRAIRAH